MDGASLPVPTAPQSLASMEAATAVAAATEPVGGGFAAVLGATNLTELTADQQAVLGQLLADTTSAVRAGNAVAGQESPPPAILRLLKVLGFDLDASPGERAVELRGLPEATPDTSPPETDPAADLAGLLAALPSVVALPATEGVRVRESVPVEAEAPTEAVALLAVLRQVLDPATQGAATWAPSSQPPGAEAVRIAETVSREGEAPPAESAALLAVLRQVLDRAPPSQRFASPASLPPPHLAGVTAPPAPAAAPAGSAAPVADAARPMAALLAATEASGGEPKGRDSAAAELTRGLATLLDVEQPMAGRAALAAAPEVVPGRTAPPAELAVSVPVGARGWDRAFSERVVWLVSQQFQAAEVRLNPPHLGPVEVRLSLAGQEASVSFTVTHGAARDAVEQAIPRLREMFAEQNLQIVNVDVGQRDASNHASQSDRSGAGGGAQPGPAESAAPAGELKATAERRGQTALLGLVDEYV